MPSTAKKKGCDNTLLYKTEILQLNDSMENTIEKENIWQIFVLYGNNLFKRNNTFPRDKRTENVIPHYIVWTVICIKYQQIKERDTENSYNGYSLIMLRALSNDCQSLHLTRYYEILFFLRCN